MTIRFARSCRSIPAYIAGSTSRRPARHEVPSDSAQRSASISARGRRSRFRRYAPALECARSCSPRAPRREASIRFRAYDLTGQLTPFSFVSFIGAAGRARSSRVTDSAFSTNYVRGEAGLRLHNLWFLGGVLRRDSIQLPGPIVFDTLFRTQRAGTATGVTAAIRGQLWRVIHADLQAVRWANDSGLYRPRYQTRSELSIKTNLLRQFPSGISDCCSRPCTSTGPAYAFPSTAACLRSIPCRAIGRSRRSWKFGFSAPRFPGSSGIFWASATHKCRSLSCRGRRTSTAYAGSSTIDKCLCHSVG